MTQQHINIADTELSLTNEKMKLEVNDLRLYYGESLALKNINLKIPEKRVTAFIGPSGCGKSTLLRCFNRMNDLVDICRIEGNILMDGQNIYDKSVDVAELRRQVGMVFQKPNPFPKTIYENVAYGLRLQGVKDKRVLDEVVETSLKGAALWNEVKDRLSDPALSLSGGQQQRLCIARAIATSPEVLLMDEPLAALDSKRKAEILPYLERLHAELEIPVLYVTHAPEEVARLADHLVLLEAGRVLASGPIGELLTRLDLPMAGAEEGGALIDGVVSGYDPAYQLLRVQFPHSALSVQVAHGPLALGQPIRCKVQARDVSLALPIPFTNYLFGFLLLLFALPIGKGFRSGAAWEVAVDLSG